MVGVRAASAAVLGSGAFSDESVMNPWSVGSFPRINTSEGVWRKPDYSGIFSTDEECVAVLDRQ